MLLLIERSVVWCHDWSYDLSYVATIGRTMLLLIVQSIVAPYDWSMNDRRVPLLIVHSAQDATSARTIGRRMQRLIVPSVAGRRDWSYDRSPRLILRPVIGRNNWSFIGRWSLPLVGRFPTMALATDIFLSFVIARPRVEINLRRMRPLLEIVANIADRSHLGPIATNRTIQKSYDPVWLWL